MSSSSIYHCLRLHPGQDLKEEIILFIKERNITAGVILSCVGSLTKSCLRYAGKAEHSVREGKFEIVSVEGTVSIHGCHIHLGLSDESGNCFGGHLVAGCIINTTAEIVIQELPGFEFKRVHDKQTGYAELEF